MTNAKISVEDDLPEMCQNIPNSELPEICTDDIYWFKCRKTCEQFRFNRDFSEGCSEEMHLENYVHNSWVEGLTDDSTFQSPLEAMEECLKGGYTSSYSKDKSPSTCQLLLQLVFKGHIKAFKEEYCYTKNEK